MLISDKEEMRVLRNWWQNYGYHILFAVVFVVIVGFGWYYWQKSRGVNLEYASLLYTQMIATYEKQKYDEARPFGEKLIEEYAKSPYAGLAALILAKDDVRLENLQAAYEHLIFAVKSFSDKSLRQIARIRAARVLVNMKKYKDAISFLEPVDDNSFAPEINEVLGDAFLALGKLDEAKNSYHKARDLARTSDSDAISRRLPLLKIKLQQF